MTDPAFDDVTFDDEQDRLKVVLPVRRHWPFFSIYSVLLVAWVGFTIWMLIRFFGINRGGMPTFFLVVWLLILLVFAYLWYRLGRVVWYWWRHYAASHEILFIDDTLLIIRRPLSLLGTTDAYAREHMGPFFYNEKHDAIAFDYGTRGALFGQTLPRATADHVITALNRRFFPQALLDDEDGY